MSIINSLNRDKLLFPFIATTSFFAALFIVVCYVINYQSGLLIMSGCFIAFLLLLFLHKKNLSSYLITCHIYLFICTTTVALLSIFHSGGIFSPFLITYIMLSVLAVLLFGDTKSSWIWLFTFLGIVLLIALMHKSQTTFTIKYDQSYNVFFYTACLTGVPLCTFLIAFIFEKETKYSFRLLQENQALLISNEEKDLLIREIHHRVKNNLQIISSLVNLQIHELQDEKTINILNVTRSRIFALSLIHQKLFTGNNTGTVNFKEHILDLIESQQKVYFQIDSSVQGPDIDLELDLATPLSLIVSEIITNAFKHAFTRVKKPQIDVIIKKLAVGNYRLTVKDNGRGIPENFDYEGSTSLGMEIIRSLVAQIEGKINFISGSPGTEACIDFSLKKTV